MRIYLIRHADPDYERDSITPEGEAEAEALADHLEDEGITHLYASPLGRAQATARIVAQRIGRKVRTEEWTAEWGHLRLATRHGERCMWDLDGEDLRTGQLAQDPLGWAAAEPLHNPDLQKTWDEMVRDSDVFIAKHGYERIDARYRIVKENSDKVAVVCHGGFGLSWLAHVLGVPLPIMWAGFWLAPSSVSVVLFDQRSDQFAVPRALCIGSTAHLYAAGQPVKPRGIKANFV